MKNFGPEIFFLIANAGKIIAKTLGKPLPVSPLYSPVKRPSVTLLNYKSNFMKRGKILPSGRIPSRPQLITGYRQSKGPGPGSGYSLHALIIY